MESSIRPKAKKGERYGRLVVLDVEGSSATVQCDCGVIKSVHPSSLTRPRNRTRSCGCLRRDKTGETNIGRQLPNHLGAIRVVIRVYQQQAADRNLAFELSEQEATTLISSPCHYCGQEPQQQTTAHKRLDPSFRYNGIDRVDNALGYVPSNVVTACKTCNFAKRTMSKSDFLAWVRRVARHQQWAA